MKPINAEEIVRVFNGWLEEADSLAEREAIECCIDHIQDAPAVSQQELRSYMLPWFSPFAAPWCGKIQRAFPKAYVTMNFELILVPRTNTYINLNHCSTPDEFKAEVIEGVSRFAFKAFTKPLCKEHLDGINKLLDTKFTPEDMEYIYTNLGNGINHELCMKYVAPCDMSVGEQAIKKGTWMMTVEVDDPDIFEKVQKGEITGFSMGGVGKYSDEDDPLPDDGVAKAEEQPEKGMRGIFKKMAAALGFDVVEKGEVADNYTKRIQSDNFWTAFYALNDVLYRYNWENDHWEFASDEETIRNALNDFNNIVTELLTKGQPVTKSLESCAVIKAGKAMSKANRSTLQSIYTNLGEFLDKFPEEEQEETEVTKKEIEDTVAAAVAKALEAQQKPATDPVQKAAEPAAEPAGLTVEAVGKMVEKAVAKALGQQEEPEKTPELLTAENVVDVVAKAVAKAVAPVRKAAGLPTNLNDDGDPEDPVEKSEPHYLAGIL